MALQQHIVTTDLTLALTDGNQHANDSNSRQLQLGLSIPAITTKYRDAANSSPFCDGSSVSKLDLNNDLHRGVEVMDMKIKATTSVVSELEANKEEDNFNVAVVDEIGVKAARALKSEPPWRTNGRNELETLLNGGELPMKKTIQFTFNNESQGGVVKISNSESGNNVDMASDVSSSRVSTALRLSRLSRSITKQESLCSWRTGMDEDAKPGSCVQPPKKLDANTIALIDKSLIGENHNDAPDPKCIKESSQLDLQDCEGLKRFSLHKPVVPPNLPSVEEEMWYVKNCRSPKEAYLFDTSHVPQTFLSTQKVLHRHIFSKKQDQFDEIESENLSQVHKSRYEDSKMSLGPISVSPVIDKAGGAISLSSQHVVSGTHALVHPRHIPSNSPGNSCAQLTLFYAGSVSVYDNIPANQAHAIMHFAGSGNSWSCDSPRSPAMQVPNTSNAINSLFSRPNQSGSHLPLPCNITSLKTQDMLSAMPLVMQKNLPSPRTLSSCDAQPADNKQKELTKVLSSCQSVIPKALPVARKASLARFLEERKERIKSICPYLAKNSSQDVPVNRERKPFDATSGNMFYDETLSTHAEGGLGSRHKLLEGETIRNHVSGVWELDVEDQNWLSTAKNTEQI